MIELIILVLALGFVAYWCLRHPIKTVKIIFKVVGLLVLGVLMIVGFFWLLTSIL